MSEFPAVHSDGRRDLVEYAVRHLLSSAPQGWTQLHVQCLPPGIVNARVIGDGGASNWLVVPPEASRALLEYWHTQSSLAPQRLVVDCFADGRLSAVFEPVGEAPLYGARLRSPWPKRLLMALGSVCLVAATAVFAFGWRWSAPPVADIELLPPLPPRQQQAFDLLDQWFRALNAHDTATVEALRCANPTGAVLNDIEAVKGDYLGGIDYPEALVDFRDRGGNVAAKLLLRTKPLTDARKQDVAANQLDGDSGLAHRWIVLVDEGGTWKVCGSE